MYKIGSLFDGSGGFPLAGTLCGIEPAWASEVEPYPIAVTRSRFPQMKHLGDITKVSGAEIEPVDVITFGSPCQDLSVAGKQAGIKHAVNGDEETTRSGLFMEAVRIIKEMRRATNGKYPKFACWENVPGAFSSNSGQDFRIVLEELIKIVEPGAVMPDVPQGGWAYADCYSGEGWSLGYRLFDAQHWGVPQRRRRIYLVLDLTSGRARDVLFEREGLRGYFAEGRTPWQAAPADAQGSPGADDCEGEGFYGYNGDLTGGVSSTLGVNCGLSSGRNGVIEQRDGRGRQLDVVGLDVYNQAATGDKAKTLSSSATDADHTPCVAYSVENHPNDSRIRIDEAGKVQAMVMEPVPVINLNKDDVQSKAILDPKGIAPALYAGECRYGGGECYVMEPTIPIHDQATRFSGKRGDKEDGKGNGLGVGQEGDPMNTLTSGDRHAVAYGFDPQADRDVGQYFHAEKANPLVNGTCPGHKNGVVYAVDQGGGKSACNVTEGLAPTLTCTHDGAPAVAHAAQPCLSFNWQADAGAGLCVEDNIVNPLGCTRTPAVATAPVIALDRAAYNQGQNAKFDFSVAEDLQPTLTARGPGAVCTIGLNGAQVSPTLIARMSSAVGTTQDNLVVAEKKEGERCPAVCCTTGSFTQATEEVSPTLMARDWKDPTVVLANYIVRRLTPTECARLQGFPDRHGDIDPKKHLTDEEYRFWLDVRKTYDAINGRAAKDYTEKQMLTWYNKLHTDSAEYKMWGNGIALPTALYVMQGIRDALDVPVEDDNDDWMN